jgi:NO-binding membrane sensor protein with MHYT domain
MPSFSLRPSERRDETWCGCSSAVSLMEQRRLSRNLRNKRFLMFMAGMVFGSVTLWGMHSVGMAAMRLSTPDRGQIINIGFNVWLEILSMVFSCGGMLLALEIASRDRFFGMSKDDRVIMLSGDMKKLTIKQINRGGKHLVLVKALFGQMQHITLAGLVLALSVLLMHYVGECLCTETPPHRMGRSGRQAN